MLHVSDGFFSSEPAVVQMLCSAVCKLKTCTSEEKKDADRGGCGGKGGEPAMRGKESLRKTKAALAMYFPGSEVMAPAGCSSLWQSHQLQHRKGQAWVEGAEQ